MTAGGIGYELNVPASLPGRLPAQGEEVELHAALVVRDDALELYGFDSERDRQLFARLRSASGVGPRLALAILGTLSGGRIVSAICGKDPAVLQMVSGVGRKTAGRIVLELADKVEDLMLAGDEEAAPSDSVRAAVDALRALGYGQVESDEAVCRVRRELGERGAEAGTEAIIRAALARL